MNVADCISRASLPDTHHVLGVRLLPFCYGHWLRVNRTAFFTGSDYTLDDLLIGVLVCSRSFEGFSSLTESELRAEVATWGRKLSGGLPGAVRRWFLRAVLRRQIFPEDIAGFSIVDECAKFQNYVDEFGATSRIVNEWSRPTTKLTGNGLAAPVTAPELTVLYSALTGVLGCSDSEAKNMPLPLARWKWAVHAERTGLASIVDLDQAREDQRMANEFARKVESGEVKI